MANLLIRVTGMGVADDASNVGITGECCVDTMKNDNPIIYWAASIKEADPIDIINQKIRDAAILAATNAGYVVDLLDVKTVLGGAIRL